LLIINNKKYNWEGVFMEEKKFVALRKDMYEVKDGKVYITSEEIANAIQEQKLELFVDEEAAAAAQGICGLGCEDSEIMC